MTFFHSKNASRQNREALGLKDWKLPAVFIGDREFLAAMTTAGRKYAAAIGRSHSCAEAVLVDTLATGRLERSFHCISFLYFSLKTGRF